jgi:uncharacterized membrane protein
MKKLITSLALVLFATGYATAGTWTTLDMPSASWAEAFGIDGSNIVGRYHDASGYHGFLYNGSVWTTLNMPGASSTYAFGIDGSNIVGQYYDASGNQHGFIYTVPEPGSIMLFIVGTGAFLSTRRNKKM